MGLAGEFGLGHVGLYAEPDHFFRQIELIFKGIVYLLEIGVL